MMKSYDDMLSRFHLIPERHGQTDKQTDRFAKSISRVSMLRAIMRISIKNSNKILLTLLTPKLVYTAYNLLIMWKFIVFENRTPPYCLSTNAWL